MNLGPIGLALTIAVLVPACAGEDGAPGGLRPAVGEIAAAIAAVEKLRGGPQQYFEINATPQLVNLFVADADATEAQVYLYTAGELAVPAPPRPVTGGTTFDAAAARFDAEEVLAGLDAELPDSDVVVFAIVGGPGATARLSATVQSAEGGLLDVALDSNGDVLGVDPGT